MPRHVTSAAAHQMALVPLLILWVCCIYDVHGDCSLAPDVTNATKVDNGTVVTYSCDVGYSDSLATDDTAVWECDPGQWISVAQGLNCTRDCNSAPDVTNATKVDNGTVVTYTCDVGYSDSAAAGETAVWECDPGQWISTAQGLNCVPDCSDAPNVTYSATSNPTGDAVIYACLHGYNGTGDTTWDCVLKRWLPNDAELICTADCSDAPAVVDGSILADYVTSAVYTCNYGYRITAGVTIWDCEGKTWDANGPELICSPDCSDAAAVPNATVIDDDVTANYTCDFGYTVTVDTVWDCVLKLWSPDNQPFNCIADCSDASSPAHSASTNDSTVAEYTCDFGYTVTGDTTWDCTLKNWTPLGVELICEADCSDSPNETHATKTDDGVNAAYECIIGYYSTGDVEWDCTAKDWRPSGFGLRCKADCTDASEVANGTLVSEDGYLATYTCNFGYHVTGDPQWNCTWKTWSPTDTELVCEADCSDAPNVTHGTWTDDGSLANYTCDFGYAATSGDTEWDCKGKHWTPSQENLTCTEDCSDAPDVANATVDRDSTVQAEYACHAGFNGSGDFLWDCKVKNWPSGRRFICADCSPAPNISESVHYEYRAAMHYRCQVGYTDYGDVTYNCITGDWDPTGTPIYCSTECDENVSMSVDTTNLNQAYGSISSVNYGIANYNNSKTCVYTLTTNNPDYGMIINFLSFDVEEDNYCEYDSLTIYDGNSSSDSLLGQLCGTAHPVRIGSSTKDLYMVFRTDETITEAGFNFTYTPMDISYPACLASYPQYTATTTPQTFTSSGSPEYDPNTDEYWLILVPGTTGNLTLGLTAMDVESSTDCIYDRIIIYDGGCSSSGVLSTHCGSRKRSWVLDGTSPITVGGSRKRRAVLDGTEYLIQFHTDSSVEGAGFTMEYYIGTPDTGNQSSTTPTTTTTTVGPPVEVEVELMNEVLLNYSSDNFPSRDLGTPIPYSIDAYLVGINDLDEVQQKLTTTLLFEIRWTDGIISWPPSKKNNIVKLLIPQNDIWKPDIALLNGFETIQQMGAAFMYVVVESNGTCTWRPYQIMDSVCNIEMSSYPFDVQSCDLKFGTWVSSAAQVTTSLGTAGLNKHETFMDNSEWTLVSTSSTSSSDTSVTLTLKVKRNGSFVVLYIAIPIVMLTLLTTFAFVLPFSSMERANYSVIVFLSFLVYIIVLYQKMPENSEKLSNFAMYVLGMTCASCAAVIITTLESRLSTFTITRKSIPRCVQLFTKFIRGVQKAMMCYSRSDTAEMLEPSFRGTSVNFQDDVDNPGEISWPDVASAIDFVCFWVYLVGSSAATLYVFVDLSLNG